MRRVPPTPAQLAALAAMAYPLPHPLDTGSSGSPAGGPASSGISSGSGTPVPSSAAQARALMRALARFDDLAADGAPEDYRLERGLGPCASLLAVAEARWRTPPDAATLARLGRKGWAGPAPGSEPAALLLENELDPLRPRHGLRNSGGSAGKGGSGGGQEDLQLVLLQAQLRHFQVASDWWLAGMQAGGRPDGLLARGRAAWARALGRCWALRARRARRGGGASSRPQERNVCASSTAGCLSLSCHRRHGTVR